MIWMVADLMPASSPCVSSRYSILKPCFSAQRVYMRSSICGPVLALGAAGAGMHFEIGIEPVGLARQQRLEFAAGDFLLQGFQRVLGLGDDARHRSRLRRVRSSRYCLPARARPCRCPPAHPPARCAPASASGPSGDRSRDWGLRRACSARQAGPWIVRRQRCLLSSPTDCLISSTRRSISARMVSSVCGRNRYWMNVDGM